MTPQIFHEIANSKRKNFETDKCSWWENWTRWVFYLSHSLSWSFFPFFKILAMIQQFPVSSWKTKISLVWWQYLCFRLYSNRPITCENSVHFVRFIWYTTVSESHPKWSKLMQSWHKDAVFTRIFVLCSLEGTHGNICHTYIEGRGK
jgi:hypothetical protein